MSEFDRFWIQDVGQLGPALLEIVGNRVAQPRGTSAGRLIAPARATAARWPAFALGGRDAVAAGELQLLRQAVEDRAFGGRREFVDRVVRRIFRQQLRMVIILEIDFPRSGIRWMT